MSDELPQGWASAPLAQLTENPKQDIISGPFGSNLKSDEYVNEGVPIIRLQNVDRNKFLEKNMRFITPQKARSYLLTIFEQAMWSSQNSAIRWAKRAPFPTRCRTELWLPTLFVSD